MTTVARLDEAAARRWAERARVDLEASADRGEAGLSKIRTAMAERHDVTLGYKSLGAYLSAEYADALGNVCRVFGVEFRRQVVAELESAGLSTRAIAPIVGASKNTVARDLMAGVPHGTPRPEGDSSDRSPLISGAGFVAPGQEIPCDESAWVNRKTGEVSNNYLPDDATGEEVTAPPTHVEATGVEEESAATEGERVEHSPAPRPSVVGLDGKTYARPEPKPRTQRRRALTDQFFDAAYDMGKAIERVARLARDDRYPQNAKKVAARHRSDLLRARDLLEQVIRELPTDEDSND